MYKYIDMHCHILPGIDDGAKDIDETIDMLKIAYAEGIRYIIATPHFHPKRGRAPIEEIKRQLWRVRQEAKKIDENFKVFWGQEIYYGQDVPDMLVDKKLITLNCRDYCLIEFPTMAEEQEILQGIQHLLMRGFKVILAHVERYQCLRNNKIFVDHLYELGVLFQVNAGSITGLNGRETKQFVRGLLDEEKIFCVGTDAHDSRRRPPHIRKAAKHIEKKYGKEYARRIFFSNAAMLLKRQE